MRFLFLVFVVFCDFPLVSGQALGENAPSIVFSQCLNKKLPLSEHFKNKFIILDFWATWCGPCIASFPHLNELSNKYSSDSVVFAIISSEEKDKIRKFLLRRPVKALYLVDSITPNSKRESTMNDLFGVTAQAFKVSSIPHTVVIDKAGILRWVGTAGELTAPILNDILKGKTKLIQQQLTEKKKEEREMIQNRSSIFRNLQKDTIVTNEYFAVGGMVPYTSGGMSAGRQKAKGKRFVEFEGHSIEFLCVYFTGHSYKRIANSLSKTDSGYFFRFEMDTATSLSVFRQTAIRAMQTLFRMEFQVSQETMEVWRINIFDSVRFITNTRPLDSLSGHSSSSGNSKEMVFSNFTLRQVIPGLEDEFNCFIELENNFLADMPRDFTIAKGNFEIIRNQLIAFGIQMRQVYQPTTIFKIARSVQMNNSKR